ncbi:signal peptidase I [Zunongwangia sp. SCSIO 43204]|uniref:signal peptidase I n=1 Tax=Zunongwangia sp. SCSIO 43204 TaxID=2779359 RepID=UPI001CA80341|nr:signal peptidase I [Zunongwangia sp. SCSIO 43204]UAB83519.1 signal peptidase I [Zunongwangia sp. SCSIO 43204]
MKKPNNIIIKFFIFLGFIICFILYFTGILSFRKVLNNNNYPSLSKDDYVVYSNIIEPEINDMIVFKDTNGYRISRLLGAHGDTIQIKDGVFYRNSKNMDKNLKLSRFYTGNKNELKNLRNLDESAILSTFIYGDSLLILTSDFVASSYEGLSKRINSDSFKDNLISKTFEKDWNFDQFGPIVIRESNFFLIGDNRVNAVDSRILGLAKNEDIIGVVLFKI